MVERTQIADIDIYDLWNCLDEIQIMRAFALIATFVGYLVDFIYGHSANDYRLGWTLNFEMYLYVIFYTPIEKPIKQFIQVHFSLRTKKITT